MNSMVRINVGMGGRGLETDVTFGNMCPKLLLSKSFTNGPYTSKFDAMEQIA